MNLYSNHHSHAEFNDRITLLALPWGYAATGTARRVENTTVYKTLPCNMDIHVLLELTLRDLFNDFPRNDTTKEKRFTYGVLRGG